MQRYEQINVIKECLNNVIKIDYNHVFNTYKDSGEYEKWIKQHGQEETIKHFEKYEKDFKEKIWYKGLISIKALYPVTLCIGPKWIKKLACSNTMCKSYLNNECKVCTDPKENITPTLEKVIKNYKLNMHSVFTKKIEAIKEDIKKDEVKLFTIIYDFMPPYVFDGNNRLISLATMEGKENTLIECYLGINKNA